MARTTEQGPRRAQRRHTRFQLEMLEDRRLMSWGAVPPASITPPVNHPPSTYVIPTVLSTPGDAAANNSIANGAIDFYRFTATQTGTCLFGVSSSNVDDLVIAVYGASGNRLGYDYDSHPGDTATQMTVNLQAGDQYFFGVTNYLKTNPGSYGWSIDGPAHTAIELKAEALGSGFTGNPTSGLEYFVTGYRIQFANCDIDYSAATGAHEVHGAIRNEYSATAGELDAYGHNVQTLLGLPTSDEMNVPGVSGARMNTFQGGAIYWSPGTGAHVVYGAIVAKYNSLGGPAGYGLPITDEASVPGLSGVRVTDFQNGAAIYWSAATGAHAVYGAIGAEYAATAGETDFYGTDVQKILGAPTSDEMNVSGVAGARMNTFQGGAIYWSPGTGAHVVYGAIGGLYNSMGGPTSYLGLPTSDEQGIPGSREVFFQNGKIIWTPQGGAYAVQAVSVMTFSTGTISFNNGVPVGGWASLTIYANGSYDFSGHFHDSGFPSYNDSLVFGVVSPSGVLYTFTHSGHMAGTIESGSRDDNWDDSGSNASLAAGWADLEGAHYYWSANTSADWNPLLNQVEQLAGIVLSVVSIVVA